MPVLNAQTVRKLRQSGSDAAFIFLLNVFNSDYIPVANICNSDKNVVSNNKTYFPFSFSINIPNMTGGASAELTLVLPNFSSPQIRRDIWKNVAFCNLTLIDKDFPDVEILSFKNLSVVSIRESLVSINVSLVGFKLKDKKFPYRRFNKEQHPDLYDK